MILHVSNAECTNTGVGYLNEIFNHASLNYRDNVIKKVEDRLCEKCLHSKCWFQALCDRVCSAQITALDDKLTCYICGDHTGASLCSVK